MGYKNLIKSSFNKKKMYYFNLLVILESLIWSITRTSAGESHNKKEFNRRFNRTSAFSLFFNSTKKMSPHRNNF